MSNADKIHAREYTYTLRYKDADGVEREFKFTGAFALWRDDAGFASEAVDNKLNELKSGDCTLLADEDGVTSVTFTRHN